ncbi:MAG: hypothetical protein IJT15_02270 [Rickettsiales bacterium]|nr:hypothetical protein [Rickettsiales bacterium]
MIDEQQNIEDLQTSLKNKINEMPIIANYDKKRLTEKFLSRLCPNQKNEILSAINESDDNKVKVKEIISNTIFNKLNSVLEKGCEIRSTQNKIEVVTKTHDMYENTQKYIFDINYNRNNDEEKNIYNKNQYNLSQYSHPNGTIIIGDEYLSIKTDYYTIKYKKDTTTNNDEFNIDVSSTISGTEKVNFKVTEPEIPFDFLSSLSCREMNDYLSTLDHLLYNTEQPLPNRPQEKKQLTQEAVISIMRQAQLKIQEDIKRKKQSKLQNISITKPYNGCCIFNLCHGYSNEQVIE